jgi:hypothetical protein
LTPAERKAAIREEFGEAVAAHAGALGLNIADGDAGARLLIAADGGVVSATMTPDLYKDHASDETTVTIDGEKFSLRPARLTMITSTNGLISLTSKWGNTSQRTL